MSDGVELNGRESCSLRVSRKHGKETLQINSQSKDDLEFKITEHICPCQFLKEIKMMLDVGEDTSNCQSLRLMAKFFLSSKL